MSASHLLLRVLFFRDSDDPGTWIAQALEHDIAAYGSDMEHAKIAFERTIRGYVTLAEQSSVWYGAVLRGDINRIIIGPRSNIQDNAVVHLDTGYPTTMGELVTVGHSAIVHACKIDNEVLVGMGAIILDDVEVGARSIIGANALVTLGMKIPPGSLVLGSPAKIRRQLTLDEQNDIARWAWSYVETAKHFRETARRISS